jgi:hypothetical protein
LAAEAVVEAVEAVKLFFFVLLIFQQHTQGVCFYWQTPADQKGALDFYSSSLTLVIGL